MSTREPYRLNVVGDFYVEDGCCTSCGVPEHYAPDLFSPGAPDEQCYVKKQPTTSQELERMLEVFGIQDVGCIRYRGDDRVIRSTLERIGEGAQCDNRLSLLQRLLLRIGRLIFA
jgi:hypothetical protein